MPTWPTSDRAHGTARISKNIHHLTCANGIVHTNTRFLYEVRHRLQKTHTLPYLSCNRARNATSTVAGGTALPPRHDGNKPQHNLRSGAVDLGIAAYDALRHFSRTLAACGCVLQWFLRCAFCFALRGCCQMDRFVARWAACAADKVTPDPATAALRAPRISARHNFNG